MVRVAESCAVKAQGGYLQPLQLINFTSMNGRIVYDPRIKNDQSGQSSVRNQPKWEIFGANLQRYMVIETE